MFKQIQFIFLFTLYVSELAFYPRYFVRFTVFSDISFPYKCINIRNTAITRHGEILLLSYRI